MRIYLFTLIVFCSGCVSTPVAHQEVIHQSSADCIHSDQAFQCVEFVRNYDADTATFNVQGLPKLFGGNIPVRVRGIDTPEIKTKNVCEKKVAIEARDFVNSALVNAKRIDLVNVDRDKYFRILADIIVDGGSLGALLLAKGYAYPYDGGTKQKVDWCKTSSQALPAH